MTALLAMCVKEEQRAVIRETVMVNLFITTISRESVNVINNFEDKEKMENFNNENTDVTNNNNKNNSKDNSRKFEDEFKRKTFLKGNIEAPHQQQLHPQQLQKQHISRQQNMKIFNKKSNDSIDQQQEENQQHIFIKIIRQRRVEHFFDYDFVKDFRKCLVKPNLLTLAPSEKGHITQKNCGLYTA
uniref:Uncharacterized protein n=1 Tax=Octopus bimaculoides TaxID=37653 RepID=A0A0L8GEA3_OCTBM